ncbi:hypothetical protein EDB82DRAFT_550053 [Fusarium venenatum]|uniref:uncharacterized protein n=1 Tax=Fusarium venenatum TaxID=56646 RepID=UPI001D309989|nr:hypothetical protein EDB82DRAFT_550053 [Fusarium venenatum]
MKIESILNQFNELDTEARAGRESTHHDSAQWERRGSSFLSSTPPPESAQSRTSSVRSDSRTRTPWDAGGYSLPKDNISTPSSRSPFSAVSWGEQQESQRLQNAPNHALRKVSMDASAPYTLPVREGRPSQHIRRISSVSTINGSHAIGSGIADLEAKLERLPRLSAPLPPVITAPTGKPEIRLPHSANAVGPWPLGSPSDSILEARMVRRKYSQLSGDQSYLKPKDHLLKPVDRVHKRTISAPNPAQRSTQPFTRTPTTLPPLTSRQFETAALPSPQINTVYERPGLEQYPWTHSEERSPAPSVNAKSPFDPQESGKVLPDRSTFAAASTRFLSLTYLSFSAMPHSNSNDRVIAACRRFRKVDVNTPLEGGDICMAVENCTTGSVPRKVISHLFGRNKVCTRRIPERVWVCMCRKHYQRIRYRTGADFSVTQIGMVYEQIVRMIFWSRGMENPNGINQEGIAIRSWTFSIRRREVKRMADTNGRDLVPRWIMQSLGEGKTHDEILDVVERLHHEIQQGTLKDVPPVEFLPEVVDAFTNAPAQLLTQVANGGEVSFASHPGCSLNTGDATESPVSFVKESSPLEPVQEEIYMSERSSEKSTSSSTPPAAFDSSRTIYQPQSHIDNVPSRRTSYGFGSRSPFADSGPGPDIDRRSSLAYHDSQNPVPPSISYYSINRQMQAPTTDHQGSCDSVPLLQTAHGGGYHHGLSEFVLTDRIFPNRTVAMPAMAREGLAPYLSGHIARSSRDNHELQASIIDPQSTSGHLNHHPFGSGSSQGQASVYPYRKPTERHCRTRMNSADISNYPTMPDQRSYINIPHLQTHQPSWYPPETEWNARIGRSTNQYQQHTLACVDEASLHYSHQFPKEETSEWSGVDRAAGNGISTVYPMAVCHSGLPNRSSSTGGFDVEHSRGNIKAYQHNWSTNETDNGWQGARASENGRQERGQAP